MKAILKDAKNEARGSICIGCGGTGCWGEDSCDAFQNKVKSFLAEWGIDEQE